MRFLWSTTVKDLRRHRRSPAEFLVWLGVPLLIGSLIILASGGRSGPEPRALVWVADHDNSFVSNFLLTALSQGGGDNPLRAERVSEEEGRSRLGHGKGSALLIIPAGFSEAVLREQPTTLQLLTNPAQSILPGIVEEELNVLVDGSFYLHRLVGDELRAMADGPPAGRNVFDDGFIAAFSVRINRLVDRLASGLTPPLIQLEVTAVEQETEFDFASFALGFLPGILFMGLLFMAQGLGDELWHERQQQTLRRVVATPRSVPVFLAGKLLAGVLMMACVCLVGLCAGYWYFGLPGWTFPLAVAWTICTGILFMTGMTALQVHAASQRAGNILTMVLIFPLMMIGGSFFPFEAMPAWMATVGRLTPNGWALRRLRSILEGRVDLLAVALGFALLLGLSLVLFFISARQVRRAFVQG
jgi:ABC-type multidrug transport system permease subunit